jgi:hypothetical protein
MAIEASEEVARIDQEIETLMGDFDRPPASIAQAYSNFVERNATRALGETAGQFVPPLCHAYLEVFDTYRAAWATTHSTAVCSTRQLGMGPSDLAPDALPTANTPQTNAPLTAADQLLARYSVPRVLRDEARSETGISHRSSVQMVSLFWCATQVERFKQRPQPWSVLKPVSESAAGSSQICSQV